MTASSFRRSVLRFAIFTLVPTSAWLGCVSNAEDPPAAICPQYCDEVQAKCNGLEYKDRDQCLAMCAKMKPGNAGDPDDSAGCRLTQAKAATKDDAASCKKASAYGGGACGEPCTTFCRMVSKVCIEGRDPGSAPYPSESSCFEACKTTPLVYDPNGAEGPQSFEGADTLNCRMFHLMLAVDDPNGHCQHTQVTSATCKTR